METMNIGALASPDLEADLLGTIFIKPDNIFDIETIIKPSDFYRAAYGEIYQTMTEMAKDGEAIDLVTVTERLRKSNKLNRVGGLSIITAVANTVPSAVNYKRYAEDILMYSRRRQMVDVAETLRSEAFNMSKDISIEEMQAKIANIAIGNGNKVLTMKEELLRYLEQLSESYTNGDSCNLSGYEELDAVTGGWKPSQLIILAARPAMGKSALALNFAINSAKQGKKVAYFSLEMPKQDLINRMLASEKMINLSRLQTPPMLSQEDYSKAVQGVDILQDLGIYMFDSNVASPSDVMTRCKMIQGRFGLDLVIIDYLQLMTSGGRYEGNRVQEVSYISRALKMMAQNMKIPVIALSQLSRGVESRNDKRPMLSDLRESGSIEQDADIVMMLYRQSYYDLGSNSGETELNVVKNRNGKIATVGLQFFGEFTKFTSRQVEVPA